MKVYNHTEIQWNVSFEGQKCVCVCVEVGRGAANRGLTCMCSMVPCVMYILKPGKSVAKPMILTLVVRNFLNPKRIMKG